MSTFKETWKMFAETAGAVDSSMLEWKSKSYNNKIWLYLKV
jgi:hypothetical protein